MRSENAGPPEDRWLAPVIHAAFFLLLGASLWRYLLNHPGQPRIPWVIALSVVLALLYVLGPALGPGASVPGAAAAGGVAAEPTTRRLCWLGAVIAAWVVLVLLAPSFAWCAVPLFYTGLRTLPPRAAVPLVLLLTALVVFAQLTLAGKFDPNLVLAPPAVAALATAIFLHMERQGARQRALIDDLLRTRRELAATERREGVLAERQRLSMEIHDTLAQGLSSQQMLLQAAERVWETDPSAAREHVRTAADVAGRDLAEARRFVHDLAPSALADGTPLETALAELAAAEREQGRGRNAPEVRFHLEGTPVPLPESVAAGLLRIAQGALANVREHAEANTAALTLSYLGDQVVLDVADDGLGFDPAAPDRPDAARRTRGHGLPAMRARVRRLGGTFTVESAPGEGTVLSAAVPLEPLP
ncbi:sensor histidine kinase [Streptomyces sp. HNM0574]|uniref:sensor histidine kinase n=1 Tax=Streptomyces sp. HNM0574 TaxID=2714954 RepID=UPI003217B03C